MNRLLVVDDDPKNLNACKRIFSDEDYVLEFAQNGEEALARVADFHPDLILLDILMPGIDGYEVCSILKTREETSNIMILFLSARGVLEDRLRGYEAQADDYITKPYDPEELRAKVHILLRLRQAQEELRMANQNLERLVEARTRELIKKEGQALVGQLLQGIVHNLNNPVMVIGGMAELAARKVENILAEEGLGSATLSASIKEVGRCLDNIKAGTQRAEGLIRNLLTKGQQDASNEIQELDLNDLIQREVEFLDADPEIKHGITKNLILDPDLPRVRGVYSDFAQLCYNMIKNASDAMHLSPRRELTIITRQEDEKIFIEFQDTGSGIAPENMLRIFDPFFTTKSKVDAAVEGEPIGTGLGLYTCSQLVKAYGGTISLASELGVGTKFTIALRKCQH